MKYFSVEENKCNCHPQTCSCDPYAVMEFLGEDEKGHSFHKKHSTFLECTTAVQVADALNKTCEPTYMHEAGIAIMQNGFPFCVGLVGEQAKTFRQLYNSRQRLPDELCVEGSIVKITIMDGDLPGYGVYVFCKNKHLRDLIAFNCNAFEGRKLK